MNYRSGIRQFAKYKGFQGWVIAKAVYHHRRYSHPRQECVLLKKGSYYAVLQSFWMRGDREESVMITLMKPNLDKGGLDCKEDVDLQAIVSSCKEREGKIFSREEIQNFVTDVKDDNAIHRTSHPVVPGLEILEYILSGVNTHDAQEVQLEICFKHPLFANRKVEIQWKETTGTEQKKKLEFEGVNDKIYFNGKLKIEDEVEGKNEIET